MIKEIQVEQCQDEKPQKIEKKVGVETPKKRGRPKKE